MKPKTTQSPPWLNEAVGYQIYPQSFYDSNGDGMGDLEGIRQKLDYIQSLGVNLIWLNPFYDSPFQDAGYDVRDYTAVATRYGTLDDLRRLVDEIHHREMRILFDLVAGHTSIEHPWFQACRSLDKTPYDDYYIWTDNVWQIEEGCWINGYGERDGNFLSNFFWFQPALNYGFHQPDPEKPWQQPVDAPGPRAVREEMRHIMKHWLDFGCDGFRVDMAHTLIKGSEGNDSIRNLWKDFRSWIEREYPEAVLISEWCHPTEALGAGFHADFNLHFGSSSYVPLIGPWNPPEDGARDPHVFFERSGQGDITEFTSHYLEQYRATRNQGMISFPTGNHDFARLAWGRTEPELRCIHTMLLTMPGLPFLYYGSELGMSYDETLPSKEGSFLNRTGARTPMQWSREPNAGFSSASADQLYLPVDSSPDAPNVADQEKGPDSFLNFNRKLLQLRKAHPDTLGNQAPLDILFAEPKSFPFAYLRGRRSDGWVTILNPTDSEHALPWETFDLGPSPLLELALGSHPDLMNAGLKLNSMPPISFAFYRLKATKAS
jgi:glycosidase